PIVQAVEQNYPGAEDPPGLFERSFRRKLLFETIEKDSLLRDFFGQEHSERINNFRKLDAHLATLAQDLVKTRLAVGVPRDNSKDIPKEELGLLRKEIGKKMRHIPVRQLLGRIPTLLARL